MKIWTGAIEHKQGTNFYVSRTEAGVRSQVAKYCREYWTGLESNEDGDPLPHPDLMTDNEVIAAYFEDQSTSSQPESFVIDTAELEDESTPLYRSPEFRAGVLVGSLFAVMAFVIGAGAAMLRWSL